MGIKNNFVFKHDNDPKHAARQIKAWLSTNVTEYIDTPPISRH